MVTANVGRTVGDIAKYIQMDLAYGVAGVTAGLLSGVLTGALDPTGLEPGTTVNFQSYPAALVSLVISLALFVAAGRSHESRGDWLSAASFGAFGMAILWALDTEVTIPEVGNGNGGSESSATRQRRQGNTRQSNPRSQRRRQREKQTWAQNANSPRTRRREQGTWG